MSIEPWDEYWIEQERRLKIKNRVLGVVGLILVSGWLGLAWFIMMITPW